MFPSRRYRAWPAFSRLAEPTRRPGSESADWASESDLLPVHQPGVVGVGCEEPLPDRAGHGVQVVAVVAGRRRDNVEAAWHEDELVMAGPQRQVQAPVSGIDPLEGEALLGTDSIVVELLQGAFSRGMVDQWPAGVKTSTRISRAAGSCSATIQWIRRSVTPDPRVSTRTSSGRIRRGGSSDWAGAETMARSQGLSALRSYGIPGGSSRAKGLPSQTSTRPPTVPKPSTVARPPSQMRAVSSALV